MIYIVKESCHCIAELVRTGYYTRKMANMADDVGHNLKCNRKTTCTKKTIIGDNVTFNGGVLTGVGKIVIGDYCQFGPDIYIQSGIHNYDYGQAIPYDNTVIGKDIEIKDFVWCGAKTIILAGASIGEGAIIQAGSVVVGSIPDFAIAGGHPARPFKYRDIDHYIELKREGKFFSRQNGYEEYIILENEG